MNRLNDLKEEIEQKCRRLDQQVAELNDDKHSLMLELDSLKSRLGEKEDLERRESSSDLSKQLMLQQKLESTLEELYKLESEKEKYRIQYETAKAEQATLIEQVRFLNWF